MESEDETGLQAGAGVTIEGSNQVTGTLQSLSLSLCAGQDVKETDFYNSPLPVWQPVARSLLPSIHTHTCMTLLFSSSPASLLLIMTDTTDKEFDTLELRNRTVTETLSPVEDLGQEKKVSEESDQCC